MKLRLNIWTMGLGLLAALTLTAGMAVLVLLGTGWGNDQVRRAVVRTVQDRLNGQVTIERVETGFRTHLTMRGVSLSLPDVHGGGEVAGADEIRIDFNVWDAALGDAPLYSVGIEGFRMAYIEDAAGSGMNSLDLLFEGPARDGEAAGSQEAARDGEAAQDGEAAVASDGGTSGLPFDLRDLRIRNGVFRYFDPGDSTAVSAGEVGFSGSVLRPFTVEGEIDAGHVAYRIAGYEDAGANMRADVYFEGDDLTVHDLTMESAHGPPIKYHVTGEISTAEENPATLDFAANGQVGAILRIIGFENTMPGIFTMTGSLRDSLTDPAIEARLTSPVVRSEYGAFNLAAVDLAYARNVLTVNRFRGRHAAGWISGRGLLDFSGESTGYRLQLESPGIALPALPTVLTGDDSELEGKVGLAFEMEGDGFDDAPRRADLSASSALVSISGLPLREVTATAAYRRGLLRVDLREASFHVDTEGQLGTDGNIQLTGSVDVEDVGRLPPPLDFDKLRGTGDLDLYLLGTLRRPTVRLGGWVSGLAYGDVLLGETKVEGFLDERRNLTINAVLDRLELRARTNLAGDRAVSGYFNVHDLRLGDYLSSESWWGLDAILRMRGDFAGTLQQPSVTGKGTVQNLSIQNEALGDTDLDMTISTDRLDFTMTRVPGPTVHAEGSVELTGQYPYDLRVDLLQTSLSPLLSILSKRPIEGGTGTFSGSVHAVGLAGYPDLSTITVSLDSLDVLMNDRILHSEAPSTVKLENQVITVDEFRLAGDFGRVTVDGTASLAADGPVDLETVLEGVQLELFSPFLVSDGMFSGAMDGAISLGGTPGDPSIDGLLTVSDVSYARGIRTNLLGTVTASALYEDRLLRVPMLSVDSPLGRSEIDLVYPVDLRWAPDVQPESLPAGERYTASLVVDNLAVAPLREFFEVVPADLDGYIRGRIDVNGSVRDRGDVNGVMALDSLKLFGLQNELVNTNPVRLHFDGAHIHMDSMSATIRRINQPDDERGRLTMRGRLAYVDGGTEAGVSDLVILGEQISMDALMALANLDLPLGGNVNTRIEVTGPASARVIDARASMDQPRYNQASLDSLSVHMVYGGGEIAVRDLRISKGGDTITAHGTIPYDPARTEWTGDATGVEDIALTVEGDDIDLSFLSGIVYDLERIEGKADIRMSIGGTPASPRSVGQVTVRGAAVRFREFEPMFRADVLQVDVDGGAFALKPAAFRAGDGTVRVSGDLLTDNLSFAEIEAYADFSQAEVERLGSAMLVIDGTLAWTGNRDLSRIYNVADPVVVTGVVTHSLDIGELLLDNAIIRPQDTPDPFLESIALDVAVDVTDLDVENNIAQLTVEGGVALGNTVQNPLVTGNAVAEEDGVIRYLGATFELETGRIDLTRRVPLESFTALIEYPVAQLDPVLNIQAWAPRVRDIHDTYYEVELLASGPVSTVTPQLRAAPRDDNATEILASGSRSLAGPEVIYGPEVVSLLTFGTAGLTSLATPDEYAGMRNRAFLMTGEALAEALLNLDEVQVEGDPFSMNSAIQAGSPVQLTLSKRINRRARVSFTRLFQSSEYSLRVGYQLTDFLYIETFSDQSGELPQNGIDLRVKFRFR